MQQIEYWFDKNKLGGSTDVAPIKQKFKQMMFSNGVLKQRGEEVFNAIWGNEGLREDLLDLSESASKSPMEQFRDSVDNISSSFYRFIHVK